MRLLIAAVVLAFMAGGCGGNNSSPSSPSPTVSSVAVSVAGPIKVGQTTQATATATMSNGSQQPVASGFTSSATDVAFVSESGAVTGMGNGQTVISVVHGGRQGTANLRVVPDYQGTWTGSYVIASCTASGILLEVEACTLFAPGEMLPYAAVISQSGASLGVSFFFGQIDFDPTTATIETDGSFAAQASRIFEEFVHMAASAHVFQISAGNLRGSFTHVWTALDVEGAMTFTADITGGSRVSNLTMSSFAPARPPLGGLTFQHLVDLLRR